MLPMALKTSIFICPTTEKTILKEALSVSTSTYLGKGTVNFLSKTTAHFAVVFHF